MSQRQRDRKSDTGRGPSASGATPVSGSVSYHQPGVHETGGGTAVKQLFEGLADKSGVSSSRSGVRYIVFVDRLELLKETVPGLTRVGYLANPGYEVHKAQLSEMSGVARGLGLTLHLAEVHAPSELRMKRN